MRVVYRRINTLILQHLYVSDKWVSQKKMNMQKKITNKGNKYPLMPCGNTFIQHFCDSNTDLSTLDNLLIYI